MLTLYQGLMSRHFGRVEHMGHNVLQLISVKPNCYTSLVCRQFLVASLKASLSKDRKLCFEFLAMLVTVYFLVSICLNLNSEVKSELQAFPPTKSISRSIQVQSLSYFATQVVEWTSASRLASDLCSLSAFVCR